MRARISDARLAVTRPQLHLSQSRILFRNAEPLLDRIRTGWLAISETTGMFPHGSALNRRTAARRSIPTTAPSSKMAQIDNAGLVADSSHWDRIRQRVLLAAVTVVILAGAACSRASPPLAKAVSHAALPARIPEADSIPVLIGPPTRPAAPVNLTSKWTTARVNLRASADTGADIVRVVPQGRNVWTLPGDPGAFGWLMVYNAPLVDTARTPAAGWIAARYLQADSGASRSRATLLTAPRASRPVARQSADPTSSAMHCAPNPVSFCTVYVINYPACRYNRAEAFSDARTRDPVAAARHSAREWKPALRQAAFEGCLDGLRQVPPRYMTP
jgi:hypothetical protein